MVEGHEPQVPHRAACAAPLRSSFSVHAFLSKEAFNRDGTRSAFGAVNYSITAFCSRTSA
ncbi:hypothetical protein RB2665 [Rhodopirellula baltica SH 1]|uniref:Uncharacterized protein n=1 Tax=Rhodopirellula baltica (strain DSM 10527 / NCIMB 13988 / SH1) TaxID=243090 RepID=Q7UVF6_RHOBA|nr:hypothetical protein RB2665 [Rhodopirellula baltica SH 1]